MQAFIVLAMMKIVSFQIIFSYEEYAVFLSKANCIAFWSLQYIFNFNKLFSYQMFCETRSHHQNYQHSSILSQFHFSCWLDYHKQSCSSLFLFLVVLFESLQVWLHSFLEISISGRIVEEELINILDFIFEPLQEKFLTEEALLVAVIDNSGQELAEILGFVFFQEEVLDVQQSIKLSVGLDQSS